MFSQEEWEAAKKAEAEALKVKVGGVLHLKFIGVDGWDRPIFIDDRFPKMYFGDTDKLFHPDALATEVLSYYQGVPELDRRITYFGDYYGCEPWGGSLRGIQIIFEEL